MMRVLKPLFGSLLVALASGALAAPMEFRFGPEAFRVEETLVRGPASEEVES